MKIKVESFGIIPIRKQGGKWQVFLVKHKAGHFGFPKGHRDEKESEKETAEREMKEETGLSVKRYLPLPPLSESYDCTSHGKFVSKKVTYFIAEVEGEVAFKSEIEEGEWVDFDKALDKLTFPGAKEIFTKVKSEQVAF